MFSESTILSIRFSEIELKADFSLVAAHDWPLWGSGDSGRVEIMNGSSLFYDVWPFPESLGCDRLVLRPLLTSARHRVASAFTALAFGQALLPGNPVMDSIPRRVAI